jgi:uncharacterized FAD-dependent dehydrogenase
MVVEIHPEDLPQIPISNHPCPSKGGESNSQLSMMYFQEQLEEVCWQQGGRTQVAPAQRMTDFIKQKHSSDLPSSSYIPGLLAIPFHYWMPGFITKRLIEGFRFFDSVSHGFLTREAVMIGVETRTSAPVRILRHPETMQHIQLKNLYPCGEGAGYAGGIVSAAIDGELCANSVVAYNN